MRLSVLLILIAVFTSTASVYSQATRLTVKMENARLSEVFDAIEKQSEFYFFYNRDYFNDDRIVSVDVENKLLDEVLKELLKGEAITWEIFDRNILLRIPEAPLTTAQQEVMQQQNAVSGTVTDESGQPLPGVTVVVKGTTRGTVTNADGEYSLANIPEDATLVFSFVGMKTQEVEVGNQTLIDVTMVVDAVGIEEVVAIGYGVQKKKLITGSTVQIDGESLQKNNSVSPLTAMQSQSPGVSITKYSGKPGSDFKINIRGLGTIGNANPLVIIDDVVGGDLNLINPSDIESIDILKDAASSAIYGARAANGVILITTKQGKKGKNTISYDGYYGIQNIAKYLKMLDAPTYLAMQEESHLNIGAPVPNWSEEVPTYNRIQNGWMGTDWQKEFTNENAPVQNHSLNITGGTEMSTYSMGMSYTSQEGIYGQPVAPLYERYSFRLNSEYVIHNNSSFDVIKIGENLLYNFINQKHNQLGTGNIYSNDIRAITYMTPLMPVYDDNGNYETEAWGEVSNPIGMYDYVRSNDETKRHNLRINTYLEIQPVEGLVFRSNFGYKYSSYGYRRFVPPYSLGGRAVESLDRVEQNLSAGFGYQLDNTISYKNTINHSHQFEMLIGQSIEKSGLGQSMYAQNRGMIFNTFEYAYLSNVKTLNPSNIVLNGTPWERHQLSSIFSRLNYNYKETYMASLIMRADGSSNFAPDNRWGYFPSISAGWIISNESFLESAVGIFDYMKLRASWGQNGNENIDPFQYLAIYSFSGADYYFGPEKDSRDVGAYPSILPNKDVTWETSEQLNIGIDARFLDSRLGLNADLYTKITKDWLVQAPVPSAWGASAPFINGGDIENKGVELVLSWNDKVGDFTYGITANVAFNKNEVTRIDNPEGIIEGGMETFSTADRSAFYRAEVGYPIGYFYGYKTAGVFQSQADIDSYTGAKLDDVEPGDLIFLDVNGNGVIDSEDKTMIGDPNPDAIYGFTFNMAYKGFDFSLSTNGVFGNQVAISTSKLHGIYENWPAEYLKRWHGEGTSNRYPRVEAKPSPNWGWNSDLSVEDGDFLRIQNVTLGYDFKNLASQIPLAQARVYIAANNLYTFTKYFGADPEIGHANEDWSKGIDVGFYPSPRTFLIGINLKF